MNYNWQHPKWPEFSYDRSEIEGAARSFDVQVECVRAVLRSFDTATAEGKRLEAMVAEAEPAIRDRPRDSSFETLLTFTLDWMNIPVVV